MAQFDDIIEISKLCLASYASPINQRHHSYLRAAFTDQDIVHGSLGRGFCRVMWNSSSTAVVFRGTREWMDWTISNVRCHPARLITNSPERPSVHSGFQQALYYIDKSTKKPAFSSILDRVSALSVRSSDVIITGHSLGGAIATLFAIKLALARPDIIPRLQLITFGAPAVGFEGFKSLTEKLGFPITRVVNANDGVPFTPPLFYQHVGQEYWLKSNQLELDRGWTKRLPIALAAPFSMYSDHSMLKYIVALHDVAARPLPKWVIKRLQREAQQAENSECIRS